MSKNPAQVHFVKSHSIFCTGMTYDGWPIECNCPVRPVPIAPLTSMEPVKRKPEPHPRGSDECENVTRDIKQRLKATRKRLDEPRADDILELDDSTYLSDSFKKDLREVVEESQQYLRRRLSEKFQKYPLPCFVLDFNEAHTQPAAADESSSSLAKDAAEVYNDYPHIRKYLSNITMGGVDWFQTVSTCLGLTTAADIVVESILNHMKSLDCNPDVAEYYFNGKFHEYPESKAA